MPDLVEVVEFAFCVDQAIGEGVGGGVEVAVGLEESALGEDFAGTVFHGEVDPGLVEVALLGDEGVADAFVLNDDIGDESCRRARARSWSGRAERSRGAGDIVVR